MPKTQDWKQMMEASRQHNRELEVRYCSSVPRKPLPEGRVLVHNHIAHTKDMPAGVHGFRFWTQKAEPNRMQSMKSASAIRSGRAKRKAQTQLKLWDIGNPSAFALARGIFHNRAETYFFRDKLKTTKL